MKIKLSLLCVLASSLLILLPGCMSLASIAEQLKNDPATVKIRVGTIYGTIEFERSFPTNWTQPIILTMPTTVSTNR